MGLYEIKQVNYSLDQVRSHIGQLAYKAMKKGFYTTTGHAAKALWNIAKELGYEAFLELTEAIQPAIALRKTFPFSYKTSYDRTLDTLVNSLLLPKHKRFLSGIVETVLDKTETFLSNFLCKPVLQIA